MGVHALIDFNWLQLFVFLRWIHFKHLLHLTDGKFSLTWRVQTGHIQPRPGMGPGFCSMPAICSNLLISSADMGWSLLKNLSLVGCLLWRQRRWRVCWRTLHDQMGCRVGCTAWRLLLGNYPVCPSVSWSVCHNFWRGREVLLLSEHLFWNILIFFS